jgi:hypothetical protein
MNIQGGPEELATFIRALNDEPIYIVEEKPREVPIPLTRPRAAATPKSNNPNAWFAFAIFVACGLALLARNLV